MKLMFTLFKISPTEHGFILPFEVISMLLLAAMIGCIVIAMKTSKDSASPTFMENGLEDAKKEGAIATFNTNESTLEEVI